MLTSTATFRLQDLWRKVQLFLGGRSQDHAIVSITARVRNNGSFCWNISYYLHYRVVSKSKVSIRRCERWFVHCISKTFERFTSSTGNVEICFYYLRGYVKRYNEILVFILTFHNILFVLIFHKTKKQKLRAQHGALKLSLENCISFALVTLWHNCY